MKKLFGFALLAGCFACHAVQAASTNVDGQVFIVTKGQQTIKLALVNVVAVPEKTLSATFTASAKTLIAERQTLAETIEKKKAEAIALMASVRYSDGSDGSPFDELARLLTVCKPTLDVKEYLRCANTAEGRQATERIKVLTAEYKEAMQPANAVRRELRPLMKEHREATARLRALMSTDMLSAGAIDQAKSDPDGKFSLSVPIGQRIAIIADSTRAVVDNKESYQWIVWFTPKKGAKNSLFLANDNLLETNCGTCAQLADMRTYPDVSGGPELISIQ